VKRARRKQRKVRWYGGGWRLVEIVTAVGHWYKAGEGLVPIRWVHVHDKTGTHRDDYFFTTDLKLTPRQISEASTGRWSIEIMFQEVRAYLGLETTCGWTQKTVLRAAARPVRLVHAGGAAVFATAPTCAWHQRHLVGQEERDLFRRDQHRTPLVVARLGF
jgi:hypothetical protein